MTYLVTLIAPTNEFSSFDDIVLPSTIVSLDLSFNKLTSVVGVIFPSNLTSLNNNITEFEIRETDLTILANLANFTMDDLAQSDCPTSGATTETISNVQICVVSGLCLPKAANIGVVYLSVTVSSLISLWFLALLVGHLTKKGKHAQTDTHVEKQELSGATASRHWSLAKEEELLNDVRFDPELASLRIDPSDVMQVRSLAHGGFAMTSLVYFGDKQAVMKKVTMHARGQDRDQMLAFMDEIRVCAKLDHPHVVAFLGIMWTNIAELSAIVEYVPRGNLALFLKEKKSTRKSARSMFTWMGASGDTPSKLSLALQIAEALVYLQSFSPPVIHGHLKAEVVLLDSNWAPKLNGLGYQLDAATRSIEDRAWVAPEVLTSGEFDEKSDIYSFGVVMSELDRCKRPFSRKESRRQSVEGAILLKPTFRDDCPAEIQQIAQRCLEDEAADRPTAMELYYSYLSSNLLPTLEIPSDWGDLELLYVSAITTRMLGVARAEQVQPSASGDKAFEEKYEKASAKSSTSLATLLLLLLSLASAVFLLLMIIVIKRKVIDERRSKASHLEKLRAARRANDESGDEDEEDDMKSSSAPLADDVRNDPDFERYRIPQSDLERVKQLAKGAGGVVYLSKLKSSHEQVVVKQVAPEKAKSVRELQRFTREIRLYASLKHPKIVAFRGVAWSSLADLSLVLEYMPNGDLAQFLETQRKLDSQRRGWSWIADEDFGYTHSKLTVALDIADALVYLHSFAEPIMHRDLKAQNVLLSNKWVAKISDFGVSKKRRQRGEQGGSSGGPQTAEVGTAAWIAPEVIKGARYDQKADIYSFGVIMCELDTCAKPYALGIADERSASGMTSFVSASDSVEAEQVKSLLSSNATLALAVSENRATPAFHPDCPRAILDLARMCLSYNPRDRPTAKELCRCLQELVEPGALLMTSRKATLADSL
ncbi:hypothetical protein BBJ28_00012225 [Nothophytophthora sp. Chile5]|nr:hypothetical protein BBJ28_00012225 [Nothophytophthora sp. Chile5]